MVLIDRFVKEPIVLMLFEASRIYLSVTEISDETGISEEKSNFQQVHLNLRS